MFKKLFCILLSVLLIVSFCSTFACAEEDNSYISNDSSLQGFSVSSEESPEITALDDTVNNVSTLTATNTNDLHFQGANATLNSISSPQMDPFSVIVGGWWLIGDIVNLPYRIIMLPYHIVLLLTGKCDFSDIRDLHDGVYDKISERLTELIKQR